VGIKVNSAAKRNNPHLLLAARAEDWIGFPHLFDEFAPFLGRDAAGLVFGRFMPEW
jgi:hypothetical protein